jgi:hypothetical protein
VKGVPVDESKAGDGETQPAITEQAVSTWSTQELLTFLDRYEETAWELDETSLAGMERQKEIVEAEIGARHARGEAI